MVSQLRREGMLDCLQVCGQPCGVVVGGGGVRARAICGERACWTASRWAGLDGAAVGMLYAVPPACMHYFEHGGLPLCVWAASVGGGRGFEAYLW